MIDLKTLDRIIKEAHAHNYRACHNPPNVCAVCTEALSEDGLCEYTRCVLYLIREVCAADE